MLARRRSVISISASPDSGPPLCTGLGPPIAKRHDHDPPRAATDSGTVGIPPEVGTSLPCRAAGCPAPPSARGYHVLPPLPSRANPRGRNVGVPGHGVPLTRRGPVLR